MDKKIIHEQCIELLEMIETLRTQIHEIDYSIGYTYSGVFPNIVSKLEHDRDIKTRSIKRLELRYNNLIKQLCNSHG